MKQLFYLAFFATVTCSAVAQPVDRGALLYETHCVECHTAQMHWREQRLARDWSSLRAQVRRWQANARLQWSDADIDAVTRYLNDTVYGFDRRQARQNPAVRENRPPAG
jgi:mono/diheme cytochrome c family protein